MTSQQKTACRSLEHRLACVVTRQHGVHHTRDYLWKMRMRVRVAEPHADAERQIRQNDAQQETEKNVGAVCSPDLLASEGTQPFQ